VPLLNVAAAKEPVFCIYYSLLCLIPNLGLTDFKFLG
jgi:hypothetical protein